MYLFPMCQPYCYRITGLLLLATLLSHFVRAQLSPVPLFRVDHIGVNDGLAQGSVYTMLKDSRNLLWFGTQDGLNRYDGHRFRTYQPVLDSKGNHTAGSIRGVNILGVVEDPAGNLWVGTEEGLNRYDRQRDQFEYLSILGPDRRPKLSRTLPFYADSSELLYISDLEGLVRFNYLSHQRTLVTRGVRPPKEYDLPSSTVRTQAGDIWFHLPRGVARYNLRTKTVIHYFSDRPDNQAGSPKTIFSFFVDSDSIAWLGSNAGLIRFNYQNNTVRLYDRIGDQAVSPIYSIAPDQRGRLWLGTQHNGVLYFDRRSRLFGQVNEFTNDVRQLSEFEISKIYVDNMGIIWANVDPDGLARIITDAFLLGGLNKRHSTDNMPPDQKLSSYTVRGFMEERYDRLWIATDNGINVLNPSTNRIVERFLTSRTQSSLPSNNTVKSIYRDPQRRIWVGTPGGVLAFRPGSRTFEPILFSSQTTSEVSDNYVRNMVSLNDTLLVTATEDGLYALNTNRRNLTRLPTLAGQNIFSLWYDPVLRQLWAGTYVDGYYQYQLPAQPLAPWSLIRSGLKGSMVLHIRPDPAHQLMWLSTDRGLAALKPSTGQFKLYSNREGLLNSFVYGSLADAEQNIWMSTNRGISRLDLTTQAIKNFTLSDGLQGYEFNGNAFLRAASGEFYFGGVNGFNRLWPNRYHQSSFSPPVHIYSLTVNEEPFNANTYVGEASRIVLPYYQNTLSMEFAALDYTGDGHNVYQYQLTNYDAQWVSAGERNYVRYANLPPGNYIFQVKAANQDGHWSSRIRKLTIQINPPFWQTSSFLVLAIMTLGLLIVGGLRRRERMIRQQDANRLRLAYDIQEQVKKDIARDLHDEIGTRLATLKLYTTRLVQFIPESTMETGHQETVVDVAGAQALKNNIFSLINTTISDVRNLLRKLNPQTLERYGYVAAVDELFSRINATGTIAMRLMLSNAPGEEATSDSMSSSKPPSERLPADREVMLYRITQELVSNSLKHANAQQISLTIQGQPDRLVLVYTDNGQGFDYDRTSQNGSGLGIGSIESRVAILHGKVSWYTQPGMGLKVIIEIPTGITGKRRFY